MIRFWFTAQMAARGILSNPLRSGLTILGVTIGVASVISLMSIGEGARQAVVSQFKSLGTNVITIEALDPIAEFDPDLAEELLDRVEVLKMATPVVNTEEIMQWRRDRHKADILGVNEQFPEIRDHNLLTGRFFTKLHVENRSPVVVLGYNVAIQLAGGRNPVGQTLTIKGRSFQILGVLEPKGEGMAEGIDNRIVIPYSTAQQIANKRTVEAIWGKADTNQDVQLAQAQLGRIISREMGFGGPKLTPPQQSEEGGMPGQPVPEMPVEPGAPGEGEKEEEDLLAAKPEDLIAITNLNQLVKEVDQANQIMTLLLGGIAAVSLLVGGLGIMNIMLVSVTERTKEIGVRRAIGAKQSDLLIQFILEALYLSAIGAIAGIVIGIWGTNMFAQYGFETAISMQAIKIAITVALGCGLVFGVYPAITASSVPPVEALRR